MLSRRRRVTPIAGRYIVESVGDEANGVVRDEDERIVVDVAVPSSTETPLSGIARLGVTAAESENRHVATGDPEVRVDPRTCSHRPEELRSTDRVITTINVNPNFRRSSISRVIDNSRRRRRNTIETLEKLNDKNCRNSRRITNEPSAIVTIVDHAAIVTNERAIERVTRTYDVTALMSERFDDLADSSSSSSSSATIEDPVAISSTRCRVRNVGTEDFASDRKNNSSGGCSSARRRVAAIGGTRAMNAWRTRKNRFLVVVGLLMWCMIIPEIAGRQSHHRTCPGCPHQHAHAINRKAGAETGTETSGTTENAPSPDDLRLEAIKHQILTKLGLRTRPDVNRTLASVPRHLALETLYRAEAQPTGHSGDRDGYHEGRRRDQHRHLDNDGDNVDSSSSASYGQFYYAGEEYSYRNVDPGVIGKDDTDGARNSDEVRREPPSRGSNYAENERHRGHGDFDEESRRDNDAEQESQVEMDDFYARTSEIITFAEPGRTLNGQPLLEFPRSSGDPALEPLRIKRATLWARVELRHAHHYQHHRRAQSNQRNITLWVFRVRCGNVTHLRGKELGEHLEMVTSLGVNVNQLGWQKFNVTRVVSNWYSGREPSSTRHEKLTLLVDCTGCGSHVHVSTFGVQSPNVVEPLNAKGGQDPDRPFLVVRTDPAAVKRVRRRAIECSGAIKGQCCKQRFYVSFSQLGWDDWIIAPQGYYANYCRGDCAAGHRTPDTFLNYYTHVIEEYRKMDRLAGMQPCCAPLKFSPMSLIYYGPDSNIIKRDLPKMVVDECGCP